MDKKKILMVDILTVESAHLEKAFDRIHHKRILETVEKKTGSKSWAYLVYQLVSGGSSCVLLRGQLGDYFPVMRGVRQGDVPSPLLFKIAYSVWLDLLEMKLEGSIG